MNFDIFDHDPKISILMPNLNGEKYLAKSIEHFLAVPYPAKELVIVDGRSQDNSHKIIESYVQRFPETILWIREQDQGICDALSIAIPKSTGEILCNMGNDDFLLPDTLTTIARFAKMIPFATIYFDAYHYYTEQHHCLYADCPPVKMDRRNLLAYGTIAPGQNLFFRREILLKYPYNKNIHYAMDYEMCLRVLTAEPSLIFLHVRQPCCISYFDGNITSRYASNSEQEMYEIALQYVRRFKERLIVEKRYFKSIFRWLPWWIILKFKFALECRHIVIRPKKS